MVHSDLLEQDSRGYNHHYSSFWLLSLTLVPESWDLKLNRGVPRPFQPARLVDAELKENDEIRRHEAEDLEVREEKGDK